MNELNIVINKKESLEELRRLVNANNLMSFDETCNAYYHLTIVDDYSIGIACNDCGGDIEYIVSNNRYMYIGVGLHLVCVDILKKDICFDKNLNSVFCEFLSDSSRNYFAAICELDLCVYKNESILWKIGFRDMVVDYKLIDDQYIKVVSDRGEEILFSISDGSVS